MDRLSIESGRARRALLASCALIAGGLWIGAAMADSEGPRVLLPPEDGEALQEGDPSELIARAEERGSIRVMVGIDLDFELTSKLSDVELERQVDSISARQQEVLAQLDDPRYVRRSETTPFLYMNATPEDLRRLLQMPAISMIREEIDARPMLNSSVGHINAQRLWGGGNRGDGHYIAVLDTGLRYAHRAFSGAFGFAACFSFNLPSIGWHSLCPDGESSSRRWDAGADCDTNEHGERISGCGHGTHVSGIAMGDRPNRRGVAPEADVIPINVFGERRAPEDCDEDASDPPPCLRTTWGDVRLGLDHVARLSRLRDVPIAAVNMSLGSEEAYEGVCDEDYPDLAVAIEDLRELGIATIVASGNDGEDGRISAPACISSAIAVGNSIDPGSFVITRRVDEVSDLSNHATSVDMMAPGHRISAPDIRGGMSSVTNKWGTSMAAPHVAGAWALLKNEKPDASIDEIHRALACTGISNGAMATRARLPRPRINVSAARRFLLDDSGRNDGRVWDFAHPAQLENQWEQWGEWEHIGRRITASGDQEGNWKGVLSPFCGSTLSVNARIRVSDDDDAGRYWNSGLRLSVNQDEDGNASHLWFAVNEFDGGQAVIWAVDAANMRETDGRDRETRLLCRNFNIPSFDPDGWNALRVANLGDRQIFYVNGEQVCASEELTHSVGNVGAGMFHATGQAGRVFDLARVAMRHDQSVPSGPSAAESASASDDFEHAPAGGTLEVPDGMSASGMKK